MRRVLFLALLTLTWLPSQRVALAVELPITPDPATCDADPIDLDALLGLVATPTAAAPPDPFPTAGRPTTPSNVEWLLDVVVASVACTNANQPLRALSYFTVDYLLYRISDEPAVTLGHLEAATTRQPDVAAVEDRVTIESIESAERMGDRAELVLLWSNRVDQRVRVGLRFRDVDGEWRIDEVLPQESRP